MAAYYAQYYGSQGTAVAAAYAAQAKSGEGYTFSYGQPDATAAMQAAAVPAPAAAAKKETRSTKPIPSAHAAYAAAIQLKKPATCEWQQHATCGRHANGNALLLARAQRLRRSR